MEANYDDDVIFDEAMETIVEEILDDDEDTPIPAGLNGGEETVLVNESENPENKSPSWAKYTPRLLRTPKNSHLKNKNQKCTKDVWADVAYAKIEKAKLEMELLKNESEAKLKFLEQENELKILKLNLEIQLLQEQLRT